MTDLITIDELIAQTNSSRIHVAYLTKLGILPNAVKRKIDGKLVGCYPKDSILNKISEVNEMKTRGITYSQISKTSSHPELVSGSLSLSQISYSREMLKPFGLAQGGQVQHDNFLTIHLKPSNFAYLMLGLVVGVLVSTLNTSGLAAIKKTESLPLKSDTYLIGVDKHNLDKLDKTNINYLIKN